MDIARRHHATMLARAEQNVTDIVDDLHRTAAGLTPDNANPTTAWNLATRAAQLADATARRNALKETRALLDADQAE